MRSFTDPKIAIRRPQHERLHQGYWQAVQSGKFEPGQILELDADHFLYVLTSLNDG